jgi:hypothetical protein
LIIVIGIRVFIKSTRALGRGFLSVGFAALATGCHSQPQPTENAASAVVGKFFEPELCPEMKKLKLSDPVADARLALRRGDARILMLGGFAGEYPGVPRSRLTSTLSGSAVMLPGTSDSGDHTCFGPDARDIAEQYARAYNQVILAIRKNNRH